MVDRLTEAGARTIVYDILFSEAGDPAQDQALGEAIQRSGRVYLPQFLADAGADAPPRVVGSIPTIAKGAAGVGLAHVRFDEDGTVRRMAPFEINGASLSPDLVTVVHRATRPPGGRDVTRGFDQTLLIPFAGPPSIYRHVSFSSVLDGETPPSLIAGRTVFVGLTAPGLGPAFPTPVTPDAASMTGVQLQASILDGLRSGRMIEPAGPWSRVLFTLTLLWLLMVGFLVLPPRANLVLTIGLCLVGLAYSAAMFWLGRVWLSPIATVLGLKIIALVWGWTQLGRVNDLLSRELTRVRRIVRGRRTAPTDFETDVVTRQASNLGEAITQMDDLRRFSADALFSLPDATLVADARGRVIAANAAAQALFKPSQTALAGASLADLINALDPLGHRFELDWPQATDRHEPIDLHLPDGRAFQLQTVFRRDATGAPAGWIVRLADISILTAAMRQREQALQLLTHDAGRAARAFGAHRRLCQAHPGAGRRLRAAGPGRSDAGLSGARRPGRYRRRGHRRGLAAVCAATHSHRAGRRRQSADRPGRSRRAGPDPGQPAGQRRQVQPRGLDHHRQPVRAALGQRPHGQCRHRRPGTGLLARGGGHRLPAVPALRTPGS
jgi:CHASE2 domain-containing sensor protein